MSVCSAEYIRTERDIKEQRQRIMMSRRCARVFLCVCLCGCRCRGHSPVTGLMTTEMGEAFSLSCWPSIAWHFPVSRAESGRGCSVQRIMGMNIGIKFIMHIKPQSWPQNIQSA